MGRFPLLRIVEAAAPRSPEFDYTALDTLLPHQVYESRSSIPASEPAC
jgi:hypothetical protein